LNISYTKKTDQLWDKYFRCHKTQTGRMHFIHARHIERSIKPLMWKISRNKTSSVVMVLVC